MRVSKKWVVIFLAGCLLAVPAGAQAAASGDDFVCRASALSARVLSGATLEPVVADGGGSCLLRDASLTSALPAPVKVGAVAARTSTTDEIPALAAAGVTDLRVPFADLPINLPNLVLPSGLGSVTIPLGGTAPALSAVTGVTSSLGLRRAQTRQLGGVLGGVGGTVTGTTTVVTGAVSGATGGVTDPVTGAVTGTVGAVTSTLDSATSALLATLPAGTLATLPSSITVDLRPALAALLGQVRLPDLNAMSARSAFAYATATCSNGKARYSGTDQVSGLRVLGQDVASGSSFDGSVPILDTASIDLTRADLTKLTLPGGLSLSDSVLGPVLTQAIRSALASIPPIQLPATLARVVITPGGQARIADGLAQQGLRAQISVAGVEVADLSIGRSAVRGACPRVAASDAPSAALQCTHRRLVLVDVIERGDRVRLLGAADKRYVGKTVSLVFGATGRVVARAKVAKDGSFTATAKAPAKRLRGTNAARYQARIGKERSLDLKLRRRMMLTSVTSRAGKVTIAGRVLGPLGKPVKTITLTRRVSCKRMEVVKRFKPGSDGRFRVTVPAPKGQGAAVFRLGTQVRKTERNPKLFPTFTLPRAVDLS